MNTGNLTLSEKMGWWIYYFFQAFRYTILRSGTGVVSHCKHSPSCGKYLVDSIRTQGFLRGVVQGSKRVLACR